MPVKECILAIDLGTSGCKAALVDLTGKVLAWEFQKIPTLLLPGGGAEQSAEDWWNAVIGTSRALIQRGVVSSSDILAVCCSTQGECTIPVDAHGIPLMNAILWMDARGARYLKELTGGFPRVAGYNVLRLLRWLRLTGGAPSLSGKDPAAHMLFVKHTRPDVYEKTHKFLSALDYLNLRLTGRYVATFDSILTSWITDNRDPSNIRYDAILLRDCGIQAGKFPEIVPCTEVLGSVDREFAKDVGLGEHTKVVAGAIDTSAAAVGAGAARDYQAHLYVGTSSWLAAHVPFKKTDIFASLAAVPCAVPARYLMIALQATAGGNLAYLRDTLFYGNDTLGNGPAPQDVYDRMCALAASSPPGANGLLYTPWIYGERCPVEDRAVRAGIHNLSLEHTRADIIRAVLEGIALNTRWMLGPLERNLGRESGAIHIVGGGANSGLWCQIFADVLGRPIRQLDEPIQANVRGAAFIGAVGLGALDYEAVENLVNIRETYQPRTDTTDTYNLVFREFRELYRKNHAIHARLNAYFARHGAKLDE